MEQQLTPAQKEVLRQQKLARFKQMGLPSAAGQIAETPVEYQVTQRTYEAPAPVMQESYVPQPTTSMDNGIEQDVAQKIAQQIAEERAIRQASMYAGSSDRANAFNAIKRGAKKSEFAAFVKIDSPNNKFEEIKISKKNNRPGQPQEKSKVAVALESFAKPAKSAEAEAFENMFIDRPTSGINMKSTPGGAVPQGQIMNEEYSSYGATFNPLAHLQKRAHEKGVNVDLANRQSLVENRQVFQTGNQDQLSQVMLMMETMMKNQNNNYDLNSLKEMMEVTAKKVAEDTIKKVLTQYAESQKKKNVFEVVNKEQNVIKVGEKFYKLTPVTVKSKV